MRRHDLLLGLLSLGTASSWALGGGGCTPEERNFGAPGGTGGGAGCEPGTEAPCYEGPEGTEAVGICRAGTMRCLDDGSGYGACEGQVLPAEERCEKAGDEDCDGASPPCPLAHLWSVGPGVSGGGNLASAVAVGGDGGVLAAGELDGTVDFGAGPVVSAGSTDVYLVKLEAESGALRWARVYGSADAELAPAVAATADGGAFLSMSFYGQLDIDGSPALSAGGSDVLVTRISPEGQTTWFTAAGDASNQDPTAIAAMPGGGAVVAGSFEGSLAVGSVLTVSDMTPDVFVVKIAGDGSWVWGAQGVSSGYPNVNAVAVDAAGDVLVAGEFDGSFGFGDIGTIGHGNADAFVAKLDGQTGALRWELSFGGSGNDRATGVTVDAAGNVVLVGAFSNTVAFGDQTLNTPSEQSFFLVRLDPEGAVQSAAQFGALFQGLNRINVASDGEGTLALAGFYAGTLSFGGDTFMSSGMDFGIVNLFLAKLDPAGGHVASRGFGNESIQITNAVAVDQEGRIFTGGASIGALDVGGGPVGPSDPMIATPILAGYSP